MASETKTGIVQFTYDEKPWLRNYPSNVPESIDYPEHSIYQFLETAVAENPNGDALIFFDKRTSYRKMHDKVCRLATALKGLEVKKGDRVAIFLPNLPQFVISFFAIQKIGGVCVTFNPQYKESELLHQLNDADIEVIICLDYVMYQRVKKVRDKTKLRHVIVCRMGTEIAFHKRIMGTLTGKLPLNRPIDTTDFKFEDIIATNEPSTEIPEVDAKKDLALLQYTGGTTGVSKGAMLTHYNLVSNVIALDRWIQPPMEMGKEKFVGVVPLYHVYGLVTCMVPAVKLASPLILIPNARAGRPMFQDLLETIAKHKPTIFHGVPTLYLALLMHPKIKDYDLTSIRACLSGSAPLPVEIMKNFEELTGASVVEGYGLTETSPITHVNPIAPDAEVKPGSIGMPFPDTEIRIFDPEDYTKELSFGEEGELGIRGPQVMKGYWKRPDATSEVMNPDGFFITGDIAVIDNDGYFTITDRKKDMINAAGLKIYPREVEDILYEHPAVAEAAVCGVPDKYRGETAKAFIVLKDGETASADELSEFCKTRMAKFKVPRYYDFIDELPKSAVGKILRRVLRDEEYKKANKKKKI
ncbi:MAG: Long-chain-fatty-acid--CoA ligase [Candidatus Heimdallarchaeota archaeon LC_2]|nr:MAG: Long-chain-fatty-acid--CoA ligase [Candidatus Heimdallarchaeota archaeon LC_2]